jgi:hypothetical protein
MQHFTVEGTWWLPSGPQRQVPGTLTFGDDGLELVLHDALRQFEDEGQVHADALEWKVEPVLHGRARDGQAYTLFDAGGANLTGPFDLVQETYRPETALAGCHTVVDKFAELWCGFDHLDAWSDPPSIVSGDRRDSVEVRLGSVDLAQADVAGASVRLVSGANGTAGGERVDLTRWTRLRVDVSQPATVMALVDAYVRPLQDLAILCLGRSVRLSSLRLLPTDVDPRQGTADVFFAAVQPPAGRAMKVTDVNGYTAPTIMTLHGDLLPVETLLSRWFDLWPHRRNVLMLLLAPLYAPFMYGEHGFASTFQSAEALHDLVISTRDKTKPDHRARVQAVVDVLEAADLDPATVTWASQVLGGRNDKRLATKIDDLVVSTGAVGAAILEADATFGARCATARTDVSHPRLEKALGPTDQNWYAQVLRWVVRTRLLMELVDDPEQVQNRVTSKVSFRRAVEAITKP